VILEDEDRQGIDRGAQGARLLEDVDAVLLALDHARDAAHLALDTRQPADQLRLVTRVAVAKMVGRVRVLWVLGVRHVLCRHVSIIPPGSIDGKHGDHRADRLHSPRMDPLDHLFALPDGHRCTVCDERVPAARVKLLAWRDDLAFLQLDCGACLSTTLGFVLDGRSDEPVQPPRADPISSNDVLDMHQLLATWRGDLTGLLTRDDRGRAESSR
jgi:hypothetical protein